MQDSLAGLTDSRLSVLRLWYWVSKWAGLTYSDNCNADQQSIHGCGSRETPT